MKTLKLTLVIAAVSIMIVACNDGQNEIAQQKVDNYNAYIDSVSTVSANEAAANWAAIEANYNKRKADVNIAIINSKEKAELQESIDISTLKYEAFVAEVKANNERLAIEKSKMMMRQSLLGNQYKGGDMQFTWINKDNILSVYQNFIDTVDANKDSYSREDWDEIKLMYEAIDTRKNTVEKEGLKGSDNLKIAGLKLKFAPMYTLNRVGAKSDENAEAKQ